ncbi:MAG: NTP transferase domain-containing protein [Nitrospirota bacterium]
MNAIVFAGDQTPSYTQGINKAFLDLEGWPLFIHVLAALNQASHIETVYIIGPKKKIMEGIEQALPFFLFAKKIEVLDQKKDLLTNILSAYRHAFGNDDTPPALFLPADIPLVTGTEIDLFIEMSNMDQYDYCLGVTSADHLKQFYPEEQTPGILMPYLYLKDFVYRMNNLHCARLSCQNALMMIQQIYDHRHQKNVWNRIGMIYTLLKDHAGRLLWFYLWAQGATLCSRFGLHPLATFFRRPLLLNQVEQAVGSLLQMRFKAIEINTGGAALDIDDASTYQTIRLMFNKWHRTLAAPVPEQSANSHCPFEAECHGHEAVSQGQC